MLINNTVIVYIPFNKTSMQQMSEHNVNNNKTLNVYTSLKFV